MPDNTMAIVAQLALNPLRFVGLCWPEMQLHDKQRDILVSLVENKETFVHAVNELGKSRIAAIAALNFFASRQPARVVTSSTTQAQLDSILWTEIRNLIKTARVKFPFEVTQLRIRKVDRAGNPYPLDYLVGHVTTTIEAFQGHHFPKQGDFLMGAIELCSQTDAAVHAVDGPAPRVDRCVLGQGNGMQHSGSNMLGPAPWQRDSGRFSAQHRGLRLVPIDLEDNTITSITPTCLAHAKPRRKNRWTTTPSVGKSRTM